MFRELDAKLCRMSVGIILICLSFSGNAKSQTHLDLAKAKQIVTTAEGVAKVNQWKVAIAIVNDEGNLVYFQRGDGSYVGSIDAAIAKAKSANAFQRSTSAFVQGVKDGRTGLLSVPGVVAIEGGLPIVINGIHVGAIGVSGAKSTEDEKIALEGLKGIK